MSKTALIGALALTKQGAKGSTAAIGGSTAWVPATSLSIGTQQQIQQLQPEIAGSYFSRLAYKTGVHVAGEASVIVRPDSFGHFLNMLCGADTVTPVPSQSGAYSHAMTPFAPSPSNDLPWYTIVKDISGMWAEQYTDVRLGSLRMNIRRQSVIEASAGFMGITPAEIAVPAHGTFDSGPVFQSCQASVALNDETGDATISSNTNLVDAVMLDFSSRLSQDEFTVGSYVPADVTLLQREASVSYDLTIRDKALYEAVYNNGGSTSWSPVVYRGHLNVVLASNTNIAATTQPYQLTIDFPGLDFMALPISMQSSNLIRANLSARVSLGSSGTDTFSFTLIDATASY